MDELTSEGFYDLEEEFEALRDQRDRFAKALIYMEWGMTLHAMQQLQKSGGDFDVLRDLKARLDDE